jgi:hypothetical protein
MTKAFSNTVIRMAFDNNMMSASNNAVIEPNLPIAPQTSRSSVAR